MPLSGQAKIDYQREYMRKRRSNKRTKTSGPYIRPSITPDVRPVIPALPQLTEITETPMKSGKRSRPEPQSYNPMMVGYVPPTD